jgi:hypothetical protein
LQDRRSLSRVYSHTFLDSDGMVGLVWTAERVHGF